MQLSRTTTWRRPREVPTGLVRRSGPAGSCRLRSRAVPARTVPSRTVRARLAVVAGALLVTAGMVTAPVASATPGTAAEAMEQVRRAAAELTVIDEQVHQARITVADQQAAAAAAAAVAAEAQQSVDAYEPQLRAIATTGYTGETQSRFAAFLTSESATDLVQQMTTLDMIAEHTNEVVARVAALQDTAELAQTTADEAAARAQAGLAELETQQAELQRRVDSYEAEFARLTAQERAAVTEAIAGPSLPPPSRAELPLASGSAAATAISVALAQVGAPYVWGSSSPPGFDCSGLTSYAYAAAGVALPHSSRAQSSLGQRVSRADLQPGDLVFFYDPISHVGLYIGNGKMVHARTFGHPVAVTSVDQPGYRFGARIVG